MKKKLMNELSEIMSDYEAMPRFETEYNHISAIEFDYYAVNKLSLFVVHENYDFEKLKALLDKIEYTLPSVKRIFAKPIIHLKDEDEILPVEAVRLINNSTINHIATHSELWDDYDKNGIKPIKLLTRTYLDNYSIYENIVLVRTVDSILAYLRKNMRELRNLMYACGSLEFNLLERVNHFDYYMALGKLQTGYVRDFGKYYDVSKECYQRMGLMYDSLSSHLKCNVYRLNKNYKGKFTLHNSNILHMQKDYHRVYVLLKFFSKIKEEPKEVTKTDIENFRKNYLTYAKIIFIFAVMHFNFEADKEEMIEYEHLNVLFHFKNTELRITAEGEILYLEFKKEKTYRMAFVPSFTKNVKPLADEVVTITPFEENEKDVYVSISDVDSFRRIQRYIEKGMIYSDTILDTCPFCGNSLILTEKKEYLCKSCRTLISRRKCEITGEEYFVSTIEGFRPTLKNPKDSSELYHFRNITDVTSAGDFICSCCKKVHKN